MLTSVCLLIYDDKPPYTLLSQNNIKYGADRAVFALDRRSLEVQNDDKSILVVL